MARALFFGRLRDAARCSARDVPLGGAVDIGAFRKLAAAGDGDLEAVLAARWVRIAVNATLTSGACVIAPGDEVAFMSPFSGG